MGRIHWHGVGLCRCCSLQAAAQNPQGGNDYCHRRRDELRDVGVQVALVEPGSFRTEFSEAAEFGEPGDPRNAPRIAAFRRRMDTRRSALSGDPAKVADLLVRLVEKKRIPLRNIIGSDARLMVAVKRLLPDSWRVALVARVFDRVFFRATSEIGRAHV